MSGWEDWIFGNLPPMPARPTSRGSTFGANYQNLPTSSHIDDRSDQPTDYAAFMRRAPGMASTQYPPSAIGGNEPGFADTLGADQMLIAPYVGAHPPIGPQGPISPGDPDWTPPPSPSGPHNQEGDPDRPGYGAPARMPMNAASQLSYQQLINFLQSRGGTS